MCDNKNTPMNLELAAIEEADTVTGPLGGWNNEYLTDDDNGPDPEDQTGGLVDLEMSKEDRRRAQKH